MLILLFLPLLIAGCWFLNYFWNNRYLKQYPGPVPLPVVGSALDFVNPKKTVYQLLKYRENYKGDYKIYLGFQPLVFISELKSIEAMLNSTTNLKKSKQYQFFKNWLGNGLLLSDGDYWRRHRKIITPAFHFQILEKYVEVFNEVSNVLVECLEEKLNQGAFDIYPYITLSALDVMCDAAMGIPMNAQINSESQYVNSVKELGRITIARGFSVLQQYDFIYRFSESYQTEKKALKLLHSYAYNVIEQKKQENKNILSEDDLSAKKKLAFLDLLLYHNSKTNTLNDDEIREEVDTLLFEGHDTTASGISFTLYTLANYPGIQEKVYQEIKSIFGDDLTRAPTPSDLNELRYLEMVIKESLRLYPPVPFYARELTSNIKLGDRILPKGMIVGIYAMGIQHDENIFPNPYKFDPERFSPENSRGRSPYAFIPFSAGARNCIGQKFAMLEMKSTISKLLRHYQLLPTTPAQKLELILETVMRSNNGIMIRLKKRLP
uniref:Odorant degrading protein 14 n=1 Tax=Holotrichia parallela TaxID=93412 RepID=A0A2P1ERN9_HOLPA|nr:odorant degrading protein 14 [Holotrichia parallela]